MSDSKQVQRFRVNHVGNIMDVVLASDHDAAIAAERANSAAALAERDARIAELERFRSVDAGVEVLLRHRIEALEAGLRGIAANTCCGTCQEAALVARALLATTHNQESVT